MDKETYRNRKPDMTNNFFLMQDLDVTELRAICEMVCSACIDQVLSAKVIKRIIDATVVFHQVSSRLEGRTGELVHFNWLPVSFYSALERNGGFENYDGFKIAVWGPGRDQEVEIFFTTATSAIHYQYGVFERAQLGGWSNRIPHSLGA